MESPERRQDHSPFKDSLVDSDVSEFHIGSGKLLELENDSSKVVRVESFETLEKRYKGEVDPVTIAGMGQRLYRELGERYGILAPVDFALGEDPQGRKVVYGVVDKIEGSNLDQVGVTPEITDRVEELYARIASYYLDKLSKDEAYLVDIEVTTQYVYGQPQGETEKNIYLVDTDLFIRDGKYALYNIMLGFVVNVIAVEKKFGKEFSEARRLIKKFITEPLPPQFPEEGKGRVKRVVQDIEQYLETNQTFLLS